MLTDPPPKRWGLGATLGFSAIILVLYVFAPVGVAAVLYALRLRDDHSMDIDSEAFMVSLSYNGDFIAFSIIATTLMGLAAIALFVALRRGITLKQYLEIYPVGLGELTRWLGVVLVCGLVMDGLSWVLDRPMVPDFMLDISKAENQTMLWLSIVVAAPVLEEFFFRGFLFEGLRSSPLGSVGAILLTSILWSSIHLQYGIYEISLIFLFGLVLGVAKIKTQSLHTTLAMHSLFNLISMVQLAMLLQT